jgi:hypothetical protein
MTDLERRIREVLEDGARSAPPPGDAHRAVGRTRRRQGLTLAGSLLGVVAVVAATVVGIRTVSELDGGAPAGGPELVTTTINGVSITTPEGWFVTDPPEEFWYEGDAPPNLRVGVPRSILAVSPADPGDKAAACPVEDDLRRSFLTVQELPLASATELAAGWPAPLEPLALESAGNDLVESGGVSGCYAGWEFRQAGWRAEGRRFQAIVAFAPDAPAEERDALVAAFESMRFEPAEDASTGTATTTVIATGTAGGEDWEVVAERPADELVLTLLAESGGTGGSFVGASPDLHVLDLVLGEGDTAERIVFGAVPSNVTQVEAIPRDWLGTLVVDLLDVPDEIDPQLDAFVFVAPADVAFDLSAHDAAGEIVATGRAGPAGGDGMNGDPGFEDGRHFGFVRSIDAPDGVIVFDVAEWLTGEEAIAAAEERGDEVTNDYYVVNDDATPLTLPFSPEVELVLLDWNRCCDQTFDGDLSKFAVAVNEGLTITDGDLVYQVPSSWWVTVRDGVVTRIEEQYRP